MGIYVFRGNSQTLTISNGQIIVNGKRVDTSDDKQITIIIEGECKELSVDYCSSVEVKGNVTGSVKTMGGNVKCGGVGGSVSTMSGDVRAPKIDGSVSTMSGNIN